MRSAVTLSVLTSLGRENEIAMHVLAALRNGLTPAQISEVLLHTAAYAGVPAANAAFAIAQRVLAEDDVGPSRCQPVMKPVFLTAVSTFLAV
jgi:4-carboxymuconolactone decarboxylase